jgi:hypothetical protein
MSSIVFNRFAADQQPAAPEGSNSYKLFLRQDPDAYADSTQLVAVDAQGNIVPIGSGGGGGDGLFETSDFEGGTLRLGAGTIGADYASVFSGCNNTASAEFSSILGGSNNSIQDLNCLSVIGGGGNNTIFATASSFYGLPTYGSVISGGIENTITSCYVLVSSTIGGGFCNRIEATNSSALGSIADVIAGGFSNCIETVDSLTSVISGGYNNTISGSRFNVISGGFCNCVTSSGSTVGGGESNIASGETSTVSGGIGNIASGNCSTVGGGWDNTASGYYSIISGGYNNTVQNSWSTVGGGGNNFVADVFSTISGGYFNCTISPLTSIGGGSNNCAAGCRSTISGGQLNTASGDASTISGGDNNTASGPSSIIGGGGNNSALGFYSGILGGRCNQISEYLDDAFIVGSNITAICSNTTHVNNLLIDSASGCNGCVAGFNNEGFIVPVGPASDFVVNLSADDILYGFGGVYDISEGTVSFNVYGGTELEPLLGDFTFNLPPAENGKTLFLNLLGLILGPYNEITLSAQYGENIVTGSLSFNEAPISAGGQYVFFADGLNWVLGQLLVQK